MTRKRRVCRFEVESFDPAYLAGQVLLPDLAARHEVEHALAAVGVYAPRGADSLEWSDGTLVRARIRDARGELLVELTAVDS